MVGVYPAYRYARVCSHHDHLRPQHPFIPSPKKAAPLTPPVTPRPISPLDMDNLHTPSPDLIEVDAEPGAAAATSDSGTDDEDVVVENFGLVPGRWRTRGGDGNLPATIVSMPLRTPRTTRLRPASFR